MQLRSHRGSSVCIKAGLEQILHRLRWWIVLQVLHRRLVALYLITYLITVADKTLCLQTYKRSAWYAGLGPYTKLPFAPNKRQIVNMLRNLDDRLSCKTRIKCYAQVKHYSGGLPPQVHLETWNSAERWSCHHLQRRDWRGHSIRGSGNCARNLDGKFNSGLATPKVWMAFSVCFCYRGICMIHITVVKLDGSLCSFTLSDA